MLGPRCCREFQNPLNDGPTEVSVQHTFGVESAAVGRCDRLRDEAAQHREKIHGKKPRCEDEDGGEKAARREAAAAKPSARARGVTVADYLAALSPAHLEIAITLVQQRPLLRVHRLEARFVLVPRGLEVVGAGVGPPGVAGVLEAKGIFSSRLAFLEAVTPEVVPVSAAPNRTRRWCSPIARSSTRWRRAMTSASSSLNRSTSTVESHSPRWPKERKSPSRSAPAGTSRTSIPAIVKPRARTAWPCCRSRCGALPHDSAVGAVVDDVAGRRPAEPPLDGEERARVVRVEQRLNRRIADDFPDRSTLGALGLARRRLLRSLALRFVAAVTHTSSSRALGQACAMAEVVDGLRHLPRHPSLARSPRAPACPRRLPSPR